MQGQDDLRFRLDWPEGGSGGAAEDELAHEFASPDELDLSVSDEFELAAAGEVDPGEVLDPFSGTNELGRKIDENTDAVRQLSDALYELASNVRLLVDEVEAMSRTMPQPGEAGDVAASAMVTTAAELSSGLDQLGAELQAVRNDVLDIADVIAEERGGGGDAVSEELEALRSEVQALRRRLPVRGRAEQPVTAERVAELVVEMLAEAGVVSGVEAKARPKKGARRATARARDVDDAEDDEGEAAPARPVRRRERPLRPRS